MKKYLIGAVLFGLGIIGCSDNVKISDYPSKILTPVQIPSVCKGEYQKLTAQPKVAILPFTNNSSFAKATTKTSNTHSNYTKGAVAGVGVMPTGIGAGYVAGGKKDKYTTSTKRVVDPKLDKAIASALEGVISDMGGAEVYTREDLAKILKEQKLQQSGLFDENSIVQVGKLSGVKYIITGSIDRVTQEYKNYKTAAKVVSLTTKNSNDNADLLIKSVINFGATAMSGTKITTTVTFKVIDVETGKIVFSKQITESKNIGNVRNPSYTQVIGGIKADVIAAIKKLKPDLSQFFSVRGYILQVRSDKKHNEYIAQINLGYKDKVKPNQKFSVYTFNEVIDPVKRTRLCDMTKMDITLQVSKNQIEPHRAWTIATGSNVKDLRPGQIVKRK